MNKQMEIGRINTLRINRVSEPGIYLCSEDEEEVLLPNSYVKSTMQIGETLDVFVYTDSEDRLVSTTLTPLVYLNDFAFLEIVDIAKFGAFVDIGLPKDILVPKNRQKNSYDISTRKVLQLQLDERTNRLIASEKFDFKKNWNFEINEEVEILVSSKTPLGYKAIIENCVEGIIFHNEIFEAINIGDRKKAYIKNIRESDDKIDLSLQKIGGKVNDEKIIEILKSNSGEMPFNYKSSPEDIKENFGVSKKAFKATLTKLKNDNKIDILEDKILLLT